MSRLSLTVAALALLEVPAVAQTLQPCEPADWGVVRYVHATVSVYAERNGDAQVNQRLERGQCVRADFELDGWYAVFSADQTERDEALAMGYVPAASLRSTPPAAQAPPAPAPTPARACCRVCRTGKACGDSCISRSYTCRKGAGCACNGDDVSLQVDEGRRALTEALRRYERTNGRARATGGREWR